MSSRERPFPRKFVDSSSPGPHGAWKFAEEFTCVLPSHGVHVYCVYVCARTGTRNQLSVAHAPRQAEPFGHGINIKGRVNIVNNLRYNGPSGADDKFVDTRRGKVENRGNWDASGEARELQRGRRLAVQGTEKETRTERDDFSSIS